MKKGFIFGVFLILCFLCISCKHKAELIYYDSDYDEAIYYCKDKNSVIELLTEEGIINKYFDWERNVINQIRTVDGNNSDVTMSDPLTKIHNYFLYSHFSSYVFDTLQDANINYKFKDGFYLVLDVDVDEIEYFAYLKFDKNQQIYPVTHLDDLDSTSYLDMTKSWELDL